LLHWIKKSQETTPWPMTNTYVAPNKTPLTLPECKQQRKHF